MRPVVVVAVAVAVALVGSWGPGAGATIAQSDVRYGCVVNQRLYVRRSWGAVIGK